MPDEGFLGRWSRRKRETQEVEPLENPGVTDAEEIPGASAEAVDPEAPGIEPLTEEELVALEAEAHTVGPGGDIQKFMDGRVPMAIRNIALRRLWRSNPIFANVDGLVDYGEDFTDAATVIAGMQSAYQVGRGFLTDEDLATDKDAADEGENPVSADEVLAEESGEPQTETAPEAEEADTKTADNPAEPEWEEDEAEIV